MWRQWGSAMAVIAAVLLGVPERAWGQGTKNTTDMAALEYAARLGREAVKLYGEGKYHEAIPFAKQALAIRAKVLGKDHLDVATSLDTIAMLYEAMGDYLRAEPLYLRALIIREDALGKDHLDVATSLNYLGSLYQKTREFARAEPLLKRALAIREKAPGKDHPDVAQSANSLGTLYQARGDYAHAEPLYQRALAIWEKALGNDHPRVGLALNNLAVLYQAKGDYARAEPLYQRALAIREKELCNNHLAVATSLDNLARLYQAKGDFANAEPLYQRALIIREKALGKDHPAVLNNLAILYQAKGDFANAEPLLRRVLAIWEKALGPEDPKVATSLTNLAELYVAKGDYGRAEKLYQRAMAIWKMQLGSEHPNMVSSLNGLARLYEAKADNARTESHYQCAVTTTEKAAGSEQSGMALAHTLMVEPHWAQNDVCLALQMRERVISIEDWNGVRELAVGAGEQRRAYMLKLSDTTAAAISLHIQLAPQIEIAKHLAFRTILRRKGLVVDAMANSFVNLRERLGPAGRQKFDTWLSLNAQYSALAQHRSNSQDPNQFGDSLKVLDSKRQKLENELSVISKDLQAQLKPVTVEQVQAALPKDAVLVELFRYQPFNPKAKGTENHWGSPRYVAYVLHSNGQIGFADLGEAKPIEDAAQALRNVLSREATDPEPAARYLHQLVMAPIQKLLGPTRHIYLSPDGTLNLVPFNALVDEDGHYLIESFAITYLPSGRDLVRRGNSAPSRQDPTIFAAPDYEVGTVPATRQAHQFAPLLYGGVEARSISNLMPGTSKHEGAEATEAAVKALIAPSILHIATHGFFEKDLPALHESPQDAFAVQRRRLFPVENALLRSGLAFAGANRSGVGNEDGLLTALEASQLNLWGTKLVVLSACDTGNGDVENGDGVYGLRRAFGIAGAETIVMSLWQVDGRVTTELMTSYYKGLSAGGGRAEALRQAQLAMLTSGSHAHPHDWASFITSGDDRSMEGHYVAPTFGRIKGGCAACAIGSMSPSSPTGWLGIFVTAGLVALRRRRCQ